MWYHQGKMMLWVAAAMTVLGMLAVPAAVGQQPTRDYTKMVVKSGKKSTQAKLGAFCHPDGNGSGRCTAEGEVTYPLKGVATIVGRRGQDITLLIAAPVSHLAWRTSRLDGRGNEVITHIGRGRAVTKTFKRWRIKLPKDMRTSSRFMAFDVTYPQAYSSFQVGLKVQK